MTPAVLLGEPAAESPEARRLADDRLLERYHREGDLEARDELVLRFMPLARRALRPAPPAAGGASVQAR